MPSTIETIPIELTLNQEKSKILNIKLRKRENYIPLRMM